MRLLLLASLPILICLSTLDAQESHPGHIITCYTNGDTAETKAYSLPPSPRLAKSANRSEFDISFSADVPSEARNSITYATEIWSKFLISEVPINVNVDWIDQDSDRLLASAGPGIFYRGFRDAVGPSIWYPVALAESIIGQELTTDTLADIFVVVNSEIDWSYATEETAERNRINLATVVLHEMGHGLGFFSSIDSTSDTTVSIGLENLPLIYDTFLETPDGVALTDDGSFNSPSRELLEAVIDDLEFSGENATRENGGELVPLFAPEVFDRGSSISHLDERPYPTGTPNALMTPSLARGEQIREPGPVTLGILEDLGWNVVFDPTPVREIIAGELLPYPNPATGSFTLPVEALQSPSVVIVYGMDGREVSRQSIAAGRTTTTVEIGDLAPGLYSLYLPDGDRAYTGRLVVR